MSRKHSLRDSTGKFTYTNRNWARVCLTREGYSVCDSKYYDTYTFMPEIILKQRTTKIDGTLRKITYKAPKAPRPRSTYRADRRNTRYPELAWRRECSLHS